MNSQMDGAQQPNRRSVPKTTATIGKALNLGLRHAMRDDPKAILLGEDIGVLGGVFRVTDGLQQEFGAERVIDTPLAESAIVGTAIGLALRGYRPVCEIQFEGFIYPAFDQIVSQLAKMRARSQGKLRLPVTIRVPFGGGIGAVEHHSESNEAYFCHTAGLRVLACSNPADAYHLIRQAVACDDPVIFYEPKRRYWDKAKIDLAAIPEASLPLDAARIAVAGSDVTVIAYGPTMKLALDAARIAKEEGRSIEVVDVRSLSPVDYDTLSASATKTGRVVVVQEAPTFVSLGSDIAATLTERCFYSLEAPVQRVGAYNIPYPPSRLEDQYLPDVDRILDAVDSTFSY
jgi:2-oxoisovalerate dehydrogenase E1 component beta subunit